MPSLDNLEWSLHDTLFAKITAKFGKPDIDLFASRANFKVVKYISYYPDPDATGVDAFATSWSDLQFYMPSRLLRLSPKLFPKSKMKRQREFWSCQFSQPRSGSHES